MISPVLERLLSELSDVQIARKVARDTPGMAEEYYELLQREYRLTEKVLRIEDCEHTEREGFSCSDCGEIFTEDIPF